MHAELAKFIAALEQTKQPADLFGPLGDDPMAALRRRYHEFVSIAHPDLHPQDAAAAHQAFTELQEWYAQAQQQVQAKIYGRKLTIDITFRRRRYQSYTMPIYGDLCELYWVETEPLIIKIARQARNNDLLAAEQQALQKFEQEFAGQGVRAHLPRLADTFLLTDAEGLPHHVNVLEVTKGMLSLSEVIAAFPQGLHPGDAAWIFNRLLAALASAHSIGLVHGAVTPEHILINPADHNGMLIDWCYSVPIGQSIQAISPAYAELYPPEVMQRQAATPATDLYMAARCMLRLLGGSNDPVALPKLVPPAMRALLQACLIASPHRRYTNAWQLFDDFQQLLREHYGPPSFRPFPLSVKV